ncbi:tetratricopeptide repeat protein [Deinococcus sp. PEB2-63]
MASWRVVPVTLLCTLLLGTAGAQGPSGAALYRDGQLDAAFRALQPEAARGDAQAQFLLGELHYNGFATARNRPEALRWYRLAAAQGYAPAQLMVAEMLLDDGRSPAEWREGEAALRGAAEQDLSVPDGAPADARRLLTGLLLGEFLPEARVRHPAQAAALLARWADGGDAISAQKLADLYETGVEDPDPARRLPADRQSFLFWTNRAATMPQDGPSTRGPRLTAEAARLEQAGDLNEAIKVYGEAADLGHVPAMLRLAEVLLATPDRKGTGRFWLERAAERDSAEANLLLGQLLLGEGDAVRAAHHFEVATRGQYRSEDTRQAAALALARLLAAGAPDLPADVPRAVQVLQYGTPARTPEALNVLADLLLAQPTWTALTVNDAMNARLKAALGGLRSAQRTLIWDHFTRRYPESPRWQPAATDLQTMVDWVRRDAQLGDHQGLYLLAQLTLHGLHGIPASEAAARDLLSRAVAAGSSDASRTLKYLTVPPPTPRVTAQQAQAALKLAQDGRRDAQMFLASMYLSGNGVPRDLRQALRWTVTAAEGGDVEAMLSAAGLYRAGIGTPHDSTAASAWQVQAVRAGVPPVERTLLGAWYADGIGLKPDPARAVALYRDAAEFNEPVAKLLLGRTLLFGTGVTVDTQEGVRWIRLAAEQGVVDAQILMGDLYAEGQHVPKDAELAVTWRRRAADQGSMSALTELAWMALRGEGMSPDPVQARQWAETAAARGQRDALLVLANVYSEGLGVPRDPLRAVEYSRQAAERGSAVGAYYTGMVYLTGTGVARDLQQARVWLERARDLGSPEAAAQLRRLAP